MGPRDAHALVVLLARTAQQWGTTTSNFILDTLMDYTDMSAWTTLVNSFSLANADT